MKNVPSCHAAVLIDAAGRSVLPPGGTGATDTWTWVSCLFCIIERVTKISLKERADHFQQLSSSWVLLSLSGFSSDWLTDCRWLMNRRPGSVSWDMLQPADEEKMLQEVDVLASCLHKLLVGFLWNHVWRRRKKPTHRVELHIHLFLFWSWET